MFRWASLRASRISCLKRSSATPLPSSTSGRSVLIATGSCSSRSNARYTTPIPPVPSSSFTSYRLANRVPGRSASPACASDGRTAFTDSVGAAPEEREEPADGSAAGGAGRARPAAQSVAVDGGGELGAGGVAWQRRDGRRVGRQSRFNRLPGQGRPNDVRMVERIEREEDHVGR